MIGIVILAILAIVASIGVVTARQPVHSALYLVGNILSLALLYLMLKAEFLAAAQVIVYAGAIMVLFLFVVTLLTAGKEERELPEDLPGQRIVAGILSVLIGIVLAVLAVKYPGPVIKAPLPSHFGDLVAMGRLLWGPDFIYLIAIAIMLVSAALGVMVLNPPKKRLHGKAKEAEQQQQSQTSPETRKKEREGTGT